jgi:hypothetical protein
MGCNNCNNGATAASIAPATVLLLLRQAQALLRQQLHRCCSYYSPFITKWSKFPTGPVALGNKWNTAKALTTARCNSCNITAQSGRSTYCYFSIMMSSFLCAGVAFIYVCDAYVVYIHILRMYADTSQMSKPHSHMHGVHCTHKHTHSLSPFPSSLSLSLSLSLSSLERFF